MQSIGLLLLGLGLLAWPRLHPLDARRRLLVPAVITGFLLSLLSLKPEVPASAAEPPPPVASLAIPELEGAPLDDAVAQLEAAGLDPDVVRVCEETANGDEVASAYHLEQSAPWGQEVPAPGAPHSPGELEDGAEVIVVVADDRRCG